MNNYEPSEFEKLELKVRKISLFPYLIRETFEDWPYKNLIKYLDKIKICGWSAELMKDEYVPIIDATDIKLQMINNLYGDFQDNWNGGNDQFYFDCYWEISLMEIKDNMYDIHEKLNEASENRKIVVNQMLDRSAQKWVDTWFEVIDEE